MTTEQRRWTGKAGDSRFDNPVNWSPEGVPQSAGEIAPSGRNDVLYGLAEQRCRTCKHWDTESDLTLPDEGVCNAAPVGERQEDGIHADVNEESYGYGQWMITGPAFGCVHWEKKE